MALEIDDKRAIIAYRLEKADAVMTEAKDNAMLKHWTLTANRLYYAVFHAATALLIDKSLTAKSHAGVIRVLCKEFVLSGMLGKADARLISRLQNMRNSGDYDDLFDWTEEDVAPLIEPTEQLILKIRSLITLVTEK